MRDPKRIPTVLMWFSETSVLAKFLNNLELTSKIYKNWNLVENTWEENPDLRFGQLLCNLRLIPSLEIENRIWNIEESDWLIEKGFCNYEDIHFWGINFFKTGKPRKKIKYVLLKDLTTNHIANIILWFENQNMLNRLNSKYLEYFKKRLNE